MMKTGLEPARAGGTGETRGRGGPTWGHGGWRLVLVASRPVRPAPPVGLVGE